MRRVMLVTTSSAKGRFGRSAGRLTRIEGGRRRRLTLWPGFLEALADLVEVRDELLERAELGAGDDLAEEADDLECDLPRADELPVDTVPASARAWFEAGRGTTRVPSPEPNREGVNPPVDAMLGHVRREHGLEGDEGKEVSSARADSSGCAYHSRVASDKSGRSNRAARGRGGDGSGQPPRPSARLSPRGVGSGLFTLSSLQLLCSVLCFSLDCSSSLALVPRAASSSLPSLAPPSL